MDHRNVLKNSRVYLSGPMDFVASREDEKEFGWRSRIKSYLKSKGVVVFDPWEKPEVVGIHEYGKEDDATLEIRKEYVAPVARQFPETTIIPYVIPGRTGAQLFPEDLALLFKEFGNVNTVKEATGNLDNMKRTRECCGPDYVILSGDDGITYDMMIEDNITGAGVISVITNVVPKAVADMVQLLLDGNIVEAKKLKDALDPL